MEQEPEGTQRGTKAFCVIAIIWEFVVLYAELVFVYELKKGILVPDGKPKIICKEEHNHSEEKGETV